MAAQLFSQAWLEKPSVCIKPYCPLSHTPVAVAYAYILKSAAQRLGPTLIITRPQTRPANDDRLSRVGWMMLLGGHFSGL